MLNKDNIRELVYLVTVDDIKPIPGKDRVECAVIGGWEVMVKKDAFKPGDIGVYFETDSKLPQKEPFLFLDKYNFKIKIQKFKNSDGSHFFSNGLLMHPDDISYLDLTNRKVDDETRFLTTELGVIYAEPADNVRKAKSDPNAKYKKMAGHHPKLFANPLIKALYKTTFGKKFLYIFLGKKKDNNKKDFPTHLPHIHKSDEERCENIPFILNDKDKWVKTTKIDGTSSLYLLERKGRKYDYWVCSRNVRQLDRNQECYHEDNVYWEVNDKYKIEDCLKNLLDIHKDWDYVAIQGESAGRTSSGAKIQGDPHNFKELRFFAYNFITSDIGRWDSVSGKNLLEEYSIPWVPIIDENYILPDDFEEFKKSADGLCEAPGASGKREGYVYRRARFENGKINSFKNVSREYLASH